MVLTCGFVLGADFDHIRAVVLASGQTVALHTLRELPADLADSPPGSLLGPALQVQHDVVDAPGAITAHGAQTRHQFSFLQRPQRVPHDALGQLRLPGQIGLR
ncbi:MAG: hypothetical protein LBE67_14140 [Kocuria palustris]|nr:hypothetical protein [Kocuria palustris]